MLQINRWLLLSAIAGFSAAVATGAAQANTISYTGWYPGPDASGLASTDFNGTETISVQKFDTSLGTLNSVTLQETEGVSSSGNVNVASGSVTLVGWSAGTQMYIVKPGTAGAPWDTLTFATDVLLNNDQLLSTTTDFINNLTQSVSSGSPFFFGTSGTVTSSNSTTINSGLANYEGAGNLIFPIYTQTATTGTELGGNVNITQTTSAYGELQVTYNYTPESNPVPEPASLALLGVGLASLGLIRRRKS